ncbi:Serine/threonine-protein phosphatase 1 regulatory subunit 10 [Apodemus speciosus]|uniref:Serine/threonine-protein phosphatase 1 regulatory subunit 10 n=1 Tax=Apodemus speciosus TaxID=105296 RepID=A0ABQ0FP25_APOSI
MGSGPIDPKELLKGLDSFLTRDGEVRSVDGISKIFSLMKEARKMVSRCTYLNILLQTRAPEVLVKFIDVGGYKLLNNWLTYSKTTNNIPLLQQILLTLQHLPLTVDHLKQNNTAKLVKQLSKSSEDEELRKLASVLVSDWMAVIRSQSSTQPAEKDKKKRKDEGKSRTTLPERPLTEVKAETRAEEAPEKKKEKPKSLRTTAPSHAKFRSTGLELDTPSLVPVKKNSSTVVVSDKYNLKPIPLKRQSATAAPGDAAPPAEKKYKPLNTTPNTTKEIKVKIIPPQPMEGLGFLDALNSAPVPGIKIKKKKKVLSPTAAKPSPFEGKTSTEPSTAKPSSPEPAPPVEPMDTDRPGTPVPPVEVPELMDAASSEPGALDAKPVESPGDPNQLTRKGRKRKTVTWPEEGKLREYFYFELDETERVNVNKIKDFGEAAKREILSDRHAFETARRLSHDNMEEKVPWVCPRPLVLPSPLVIPGSNSQERYIQAEREKGILQELFLNKESPHEPDPEPYEPIPPKLIPLDEECAMDETPYVETMEPGGAGGSPDGAGGSKLPPVLANLMGSMGAGKSPQGPGGGGINVQEILTSIMGSPNSHPSEELLKQPDYSDKLKQMLVPHGLLGPGPVANGFPPGGPGGPKGMQHFPPGPGGPMPVPMEALVDQWVHVSWVPHHLLGEVIHSGMAQVTPCEVAQCVGVLDLHLDHTTEAEGVVEEMSRHHPLRSEEPEEVVLEEDPQMAEGVLVEEAWLEVADTAPMKALEGAWAVDIDPMRALEGTWAVDIDPMKALEGAWVEVVDIVPMKALDTEDPMATGHMMSLAIEATTIEGHHLMNTVVMMAMGEAATEGMMEATVMEEMSNRPVCRHFMMKGNCRYENNCAFYHPGVNGPPLP